MQTTFPFDKAVLEALIAADAPLDGVKIHIAKAMPELSPLNVVGDFTECTFTGATAKDVTWGSVYYGEDGSPQVDSTLNTWICTADPDEMETIIGYYVTDAAGTNLLYAAALDVPTPIVKAGDGVAISTVFRRFDGKELVS